MNDRLTTDLDFSNMDDTKEVSQGGGVDAAVEDFFGNLDSEVNGMIIDPAVKEPATQHRADPGRSTAKSDQAVPHRDPEVDYKQRYSDSSTEAKRLKERNDQLEPYAPLLDRMRQDPNLINVVRGYLEGGAEPSAQLRDKLEIPEDFIFDGEAAFKEPTSDSGKVLSATIENIVQKNLSRVQAASQAENTRNQAFSEFTSRNKLESEEVADLQKFADEHDLSWDDILYLKNREKREKEIATQARDESLAKRDTTSGLPTTLADKASAADDRVKSPEDTVFDALAGAGGGVEDILSFGD